MSVHKRSDNKWIVDYYPAGCKGKRVQMVFHQGAESEERANELESRRNNAGISNVIDTKTGEPYKGLYTLFRLACKRAGIKKLKSHLLRHAFGTYTLEATGDLRSVQEMMGHKDISTTTLYTQIATNQMRAIMTRTAHYISDLQAHKTGVNSGVGGVKQ